MSQFWVKENKLVKFVLIESVSLTKMFSFNGLVIWTR